MPLTNSPAFELKKEVVQHLFITGGYVISYNKRTDTFTKGKKKYGPKSKDATEIMIEYICERVTSGGTLDKIIPEDNRSKIWKPAGALLEFIDRSEKYSAMLFQAEATRARMLREKFMGQINALEKHPTKEAVERVSQLKKALDLVDNEKFYREPLFIEFYSNCPDDFWEKGEKPYERADKGASV